MAQSTDPLSEQINEIDSKADRYETAVNFEEKAQRYQNQLASVETELSRLEQRVERMEFLSSVLINVLEEQPTPPSEVENARSRVQSVIDHDADYYYGLINQGETKQYEERVRQAQSNVKSAIDVLNSVLRNVEDRWTQRVAAGRNVQKLFGDSRDMSKTFNEIETFVQRRMKDDSESISTLKAEWQGLIKNWERSGADWDTFQSEYDLSDRTIRLLKELAKGEDVKLEQLDESTVKELFSVEDLQNVAKLTI